MNLHFLNGKLVPEEQLLISPRDLGFARGYAVFDFLRTYTHHRPFCLQKHIDRLFNSASLIGLQVPWTKDQIRNWVFETLATNKSAEEKFIKIIISGGVSKNMMPPEKPTIIIMIDPATTYPREQYENGVQVITVKHERHHPEAKTVNYIEGVKQIQQAQATVIEPVYYSGAQVLEGSNSNIFAVVHDKLLTPISNVLPGITQAVLLEILKLNIPVEAKDFTIEDLFRANEVFLTGSAKEVTPIVSIDGKPVASGKVGPITKEVMRQFAEHTRSTLWD